MHIAVTAPELEAFVQGEVAAGRFRSPEDLLVEAPSLLRDRAAASGLRAAIAVGVEQADRGEVVPWRVADVRLESERRLSAERAER